jgi:hypothetical protein
MHGNAAARWYTCIEAFPLCGIPPEHVSKRSQLQDISAHRLYDPENLLSVTRRVGAWRQVARILGKGHDIGHMARLSNSRTHSYGEDCPHGEKHVNVSDILPRHDTGMLVGKGIQGPSGRLSLGLIPSAKRKTVSGYTWPAARRPGLAVGGNSMSFAAKAPRRRDTTPYA